MLTAAVYAQQVNKATGAEVVSADQANGTFITLNGPVITETSAGQLSQGGTIVFTLPSGWEWDTGGSDPAVAVTLAPGNNATTQLAIDFTSRTASKITFTVTQSSDADPRKPGEATFSGLRIRPTTGILPNSGTITNTGSTAPNGTVNYGDLGMFAGAPAKISVETKSDGTGKVIPSQDLVAGNSLTVYAISRDQYDNFLENVAADSWSLPTQTGLDAFPLSIAGDNKSAVFQSDTTGSGTIKATKSGLNSTVSGTITVQPSSPSFLSIQTEPSSTATAGEYFTQQPIVEVLDQYGNRVTTNNSIEITAVRGKGMGTLQGTTSITVQEGQATFTDLNHTVADTIDIDFKASGFTKVTSADVIIQPAAASKLAFTQQPTTSEVDQPITPIVEVQIQDAYGNGISQSGVSVTIAKESGPGTLSEGSDSTQTTNSSGIAVFSDLAFDQAGKYKINASASSLNPAVSQEFNVVNAGVLASFIISDTTGAEISDKVAGAIFPVEIRAVDGSGDVDTTFNESVVLTSNGVLTGEPDTTAGFTSGVLASHNVQLTSTGALYVTATQAGGSVSGTSNTFTVNPDSFNADSSIIRSDKSNIVADGTSKSVITVQLRDKYGNYINSGGETVSLSTTGGILSTITDNGDGTYSAVLTSSTTADTVTVTSTVNGETLADDATVIFSASVISQFAIEQSSGTPLDTVAAGDPFDIRITAQDQYGNTVTGFNGTVELSSNKTLLSGDGTSPSFTNGILKSHSLTIIQSGTATITATNSFGTETGNSNDFVVTAGPATIVNTSVTPDQSAIQNDGTDNTIITVQLKDAYGNNLTTTTGYTVTLTDNGAAATLNPVIDNGDGTFSATLISSTTQETAVITGTLYLNGTSIGTVEDNASVLITEFNTWQSQGGGGPNPSSWERGENWSLGTVPNASQLVIIPSNPANAQTFPIIQSNPSIAFLEVQNGATVNVDPGFELTITNNVTGDGTLIGDNSNFFVQGDISINQFTAGTSTVTLNGTATQQLSGQLSADVLNVENLGDGVLSGGYIDFNMLNITDSQLTMQAGSQLVAFGDITGNGTLIGTESNIILEGDVSVASAEVSTSDITISGTVAQTISSINEAKNVSVSNTATGGVTFVSDLQVNQTLSLNSSTTFTAQANLSGNNLNADGSTLRLGGDLNFASITAPPATVEFVGGNKQQLMNFDSFNNLTINKTANDVTASDDVLVEGLLTLSDGSLIMRSGTNLLAPNRNISGGTLKFQLELPSPGWYALSSPVASTYADLLDSVITQGYPGAYYSTGSLPGDTLQPNVLYYDETYSGTDNQRWRTLGDASNSIVEGRGHFVYVFGDISGDTRYNRSTPITLQVEGNEFIGDGTKVDFNVTHTLTADSGWNLIGNPFGATIDWDDDARWTKSNIDEAIYVWDHAANGGNGEYLVWNGYTGSLGDGLLAPFQGFWVKANADNPVLTVNKDVKTVGGIYRKTKTKKKAFKEEKPPVIKLKLEAGGLSARTYLSFSPNASRGKDIRDAYRLTPFTGTFVKIFTTIDSGTHLSINNLPRKFGKKLAIPIYVGGLKNGKFLEGTYTLSWPGLNQIPTAWSVHLEDKETEKIVNLKREDFYSFDVKISEQETSSNAYPDGQYDISSKSKNGDARFILHINPGKDARGLPDQVVLDQNYPNPFNRATTIRFGLPLESKVKLTIYDILGRKVTVLANDTFEAGYHPINWNPNTLASGVYLCILQTEEKIISRKMTFIK